MSNKIILTVFCIFLSVMYFAEIAHSFETVDECYKKLVRKFPSVEAIKAEFGDRAIWEERTEPSPHDNNLILRITYMSYPGIEISTMGYTWEGKDSFFITSLNVYKAGIVNFSGIDIGSARISVIRKFGRPVSNKNNELRYEDDTTGDMSITFIIEIDKVVEIRFTSYPD